MASKSKQARLKAANRRETAVIAVIVAIAGAVLALIQNSFGQYSDIRGLYGLHFSDGQHLWPFSTHQLLWASEPIHPVEYPALTGLIMWLFSFFIEPEQNAWIGYYRLTAGFQVVVFAVTTYLIHRFAGRKWTIIFVISPAVLYSLHRNWDIWAVVTMIWAIYLYQKGKEKQSAILLAISIATKFFPLVLLFPILISCFREKRINNFFSYFGFTVGAWFVINLPFMLINFRGWSYFYEFSYKRAIGSASIWDVTSRLSLPLPNNKITFYLLNLAVVIVLGLYLLKSRTPVPLVESSFLIMFAFILFNKQYSMQYVIWLAALAVLAISRLNQKYQVGIIYLYALWQASEIAFQFSYFQFLLTNKNPETVSIAVSSFGFGVVGTIRYLIAIAFTVVLAKFLYDEKVVSTQNPR